MWFLCLLITFTIIVIKLVLPTGIYSSFLVVALYLWTYTWGSEETGARRYNGLRSLRIWKYLGNKCQHKWTSLDSAVGDRRSPILFVAGPNLTGLAFFWAFGFHGDKTLTDLDIVYTMPRSAFNIPIIRDILLYSGAVSDDPRVVQNLLRRNCNVVYDTTGIQGPLLSDSRFTVIVNELSKEMTDIAKDTKSILIPVVLFGEEKVYNLSRLKNGYLRQMITFIQTFMKRIFGYPFPIFCRPSFRNNIDILNGNSINISRHQTETDLRETFHDNWRKLGSGQDGGMFEVRAK